eukprot:m.149759 g.149759  ORF g.149759 m.149759 type:complete len:299 (+) comp24441_c0_seq7:81-977(+)
MCIWLFSPRHLISEPWTTWWGNSPAASARKRNRDKDSRTSAKRSKTDPAADIVDNFSRPIDLTNRVYEACHVFQACLAKLEKLNIPAAALDPRFNRCYCDNCLKEAFGDDQEKRAATYYEKGDPKQKASRPLGWVRFGVRVDSFYLSCHEPHLKWHYSYHGTTISSAKEILSTNKRLLKAGDVTMSGMQLQKHPGHVPKPYERTNAYSGHREIFNPNQIFTSPSIKYTSDHYAPFDNNGYQVVLQMLQKPYSYTVGQQTLGPMETEDEIDPDIPNCQLEFYTRSNDAMCIVGILFRRR